MLSRRLLLLAAAAASTAVSAPAAAAVPQQFDEAAFAEARKAHKPIVIAIHAS
jgi:hypothetical protein